MISTRMTGAAALAAAVVFGSPAFAGNDNTLFIIQESSSGGIGNTLFVDQQNASNSVVAGDAQGTTPAQQTGFGNAATVTVTGDGGSVALLQNNPVVSGSAADVNSATLSVGALASVLLRQDGFGNDGSVDVAGVGAFGSLTQIGNGNFGEVSVTGNGASGALSQEGNNNTFGLQVTGANVTYTQVGNNLSTATLPTVVSNGGTVSITQTRN